MGSGVYERTKIGNQGLSKARKKEWAELTKEERLARMRLTIKAGQTSEARQKQTKSHKKWWAKLTEEERRKRVKPLTEAGIKALQKYQARMTKKERLDHMLPAIKASQTLEARQNKSKGQEKRWVSISKEERLEFMKPAIKAGQKRWNQMSEEEKLNHMLPTIRASQKANPSSIEKMIWKVLDELYIDYKTQVSFANGRFIVDIYITDKRLIIECNGDYWHSLSERIERDKELRKYAGDNDYKLIELSESEIRKDPEKTLKKALKEAYK